MAAVLYAVTFWASYTYRQKAKQTQNVYWIIHSFALAVGHGTVLPPMLAGWTANILFLGIGLYLLSRVRQ